MPLHNCTNSILHSPCSLTPISLSLSLTTLSFCFISHYFICRQLLFFLFYFFDSKKEEVFCSFKYFMHFPYYLNHVSAKYATFEFLKHWILFQYQIHIRITRSQLLSAINVYNVYLSKQGNRKKKACIIITSSLVYTMCD